MHFISHAPNVPKCADTQKVSYFSLNTITFNVIILEAACYNPTTINSKLKICYKASNILFLKPQTNV